MTAATPQLLTVDRLAVGFGSGADRVHALEEVSFELAAGETLALLGESASGKSLTAQAIMGLLPRRASIEGGRILFEDEDLTAAPLARTRSLCGTQMGMVFQDPLTALNPVFTIGYQIEELFRARASYSHSAARAAAVDVLQAVGIPDPAERLRQFPHQFSGGMRQRIVIAMAIALRPRLLIADEPTTALDVTVQAQIMALLARLQRDEGMGLLLISHDLGAVADVTDRVAVMYAGRIVETGPVRTIYDHPSHPYTLGLLNSLPANAHGHDRLAAIPGMPLSPRLRPGGCAFHPRCTFAREVCAHERPGTRTLPDGREVACHFAEDVSSLVSA